ncbi:hypothetical protein IWX49DRAFT_325693 [Phyllosticta citricarpa]|uniref:Uncharacterized protein n=1 Tax=Phyllosticta citricarpa TaxID=55181 RepID=A0ABR1LMT7_9PEZI
MRPFTMEGWSRGPGDGAAQKSVRSFLIGEAAPRRASSGTNSPSTDARGTLKFHFPTTHDAGPWHSASKHASQARILVGPNDRFQASIHMDRRRRRATGSRGADPSESNVRPPTHNRSVVAVVRKSQQFSGSSTSRMAPIASLQAAHPLVDQNLEPRAVSPRTQAASIFPPRPTASCVRKVSLAVFTTAFLCRLADLLSFCSVEALMSLVWCLCRWAVMIHLLCCHHYHEMSDFIAPRPFQSYPIGVHDQQWEEENGLLCGLDAASFHPMGEEVVESALGLVQRE